MKGLPAGGKDGGQMSGRRVDPRCLRKPLEQPCTLGWLESGEQVASRGQTPTRQVCRQFRPEGGVFGQHRHRVLPRSRRLKGGQGRMQNGQKHPGDPAIPIGLERFAARRDESDGAALLMRRQAQCDKAPPCGDFRHGI